MDSSDLDPFNTWFIIIIIIIIIIINNNKIFNVG